MKLDFAESMSQKERLKYIIENKREIVSMKKAAVKFSNGIDFKPFELSDSSVSKALYENKEDELLRTIVGNTYYVLDSHKDVHVKGIFTRSISHKGDLVPHLHDHEFKISAKVGQPIKVYEKDIPWKELGVDKEGMAICLCMDTRIKKDYNKLVFEDYKAGQINQHSVGMRYIKIDLAVNDKEYETEYKEWLNVYDQIMNKEDALEDGYFWVVREAALIEISCVILGSNQITPTLGEKIHSLSSTGKQIEQSEPLKQPLKAEQLLSFYSLK
jgi:hypothetical protein